MGNTNGGSPGRAGVSEALKGRYDPEEVEDR